MKPSGSERTRPAEAFPLPAVHVFSRVLLVDNSTGARPLLFDRYIQQQHLPLLPGLATTLRLLSLCRSVIASLRPTMTRP
jgi:hypothetical protein